MRFRDFPIKRKLVVVNLATSFSVLILTCVALFSYELHSYKAASTRAISTMAELIAANSAAVIIFDDKKLAEELLSGLRAEPEIVAAALFDHQGQLYARYPAHQTNNPIATAEVPDGVLFQDNFLTIVRAVVEGHRRVGTLIVKADLYEMYRRMGVYGLVMLLVLGGSGLVALFLSNLFQRGISQPLLDLAQTARVVSAQKDYSVRVFKQSQDELGVLTEAFNSMLDQIQSTDSALRQSEARLSGVFNQAGAGIAQRDLSGRLTLVNDRFCEITGRTREELLQMRMEDILHPEDWPRSEACLQELMKGPARSVIEERCVRPGGEVIWIRTSLVVIRDEAGRPQSTLAVSQDVTERKRAEEELERARDTAEQANRAKDDFLAALSHELRTPLNPVLLLASESANDMSLPAEVRADFATIAKNVTLEARLIDDLLDITRITRGKLPLDLKSIELHSVLLDAIATVRPEVEQKELHLHLDLKDKNSWVMGDSVRLQQVLWNVLKNAIKFTPKGGDVWVTTRRSVLTHRSEIIISDNGIGISEIELGRIFQAFKQGEHARSGKAHSFGGLGLGLAISRLLIEHHGGTIEASSQGPEQGAMFTITLPSELKPAPLDTSAPLQPGSEPLSPSSAAPLAMSSLLLVEDHDPTRQALEQLLVRRRFRVRSAATLEEARRWLASESFDLVVSDIGLPDGSGCDLMIEARRANPRTRGVALTGYGMEKDVASSEEAGFSAHLIKPVRIDMLEAALRSIALSDDAASR
ncbi:MAG: PAS domain S-box protein [Verrucomicrobiales bacterium]|nr:PAS domain S-box protein [Verrucomicrobiales bacterium]